MPGSSSIFRKLLLLIVLLLCDENAIAETAPTDGKNFSREQQSMAQTWQEQGNALMQLPGWDSLSEQKKKKLRKNFQRFRNLPPQQQAKLKRLFRKFKKLPPEKQKLLLEKFRRFQRLPPGKRKRLWQRLKNMSPRQLKKFLLDE